MVDVNAYLPQGVLKSLQNDKKFIFLAGLFSENGAMDGSTADGPWYRSCYAEVQCDASSRLNQNPAFADLVYGSVLNPVHKRVPLVDLCVQGDEIHKFVQTRCDGKFPRCDAAVRLTCKNLQHPLHYIFKQFLQNHDGLGPSCLFRSKIKYECDDDDEVETMVVALSDIKTWKATMPADIDIDISLDFKGSPKQILIKLEGCPFEMVYLQNIVHTGIGPQLVLGKSADSLISSTVYVALFESIVAAHFLPSFKDPVSVYGVYCDSMPVPSIVKPSFSPAFYFDQSMFHDKEVIFFGYSKNYEVVYAHFALHSVHIQVEVRHLICMRFIRSL